MGKGKIVFFFSSYCATFDQEGGKEMYPQGKGL